MFGGRKLSPGDTLNLDTAQVNGGAGDDMAYEHTQGGDLYLTPLGSATFGVWGDLKPSHADCQSKSMSGSQISLKGKGGKFICFRTDQGTYGYLRGSYDSSNFSLTIDFVLWIVP
jgi:hypothetical protein